MGCGRLRICLVVLLCLSSSPVFGSGNFAWVGAFTGDFNSATDIVADSANNVYVCGFISNITTSQIDADPGAGTATLPGPAGYVVKLNSNRVFQWGVTLPISINGAAVTPSGNVILVGTFAGTVDLNPGAGTANFTSADSLDGALVELNTNGVFVQAFQLAGTGDQRIYKVAVDGSGNIHITGAYGNTTDFDPTGGVSNLSPNVAGDRDIYVAKYASNGTLIWAAGFHGNETDSPFNGTIPTGIAIDNEGGVVTTGSFDHALDFDPGAGVQSYSANGTNDTDTDAYVSKLDSDGIFVYAGRIGAASRDDGWGVGIQPGTGDAIFVGEYQDFDVDLDPTVGVALHSSANGTTDVFVLRLDPDGAFVWVKTYGGNSLDTGDDVAVDGEGSIHITGELHNVVDYDPGPGVFELTETGNGSKFPNNDIYALKLDEDGDFVFARSYGNMLPQFLGELTTDTTNASLLAGAFQGTLVFNPTNGTITSSVQTPNTYILKLAGPLATAWVDFGSALATETGAEATPYKTLDAAVKGVRVNGTINIKGNTGDASSSESLVIDKDVTINAINGAVTIGAP